ncbi:hypothetical protein D1970_20110 [Mesobacillus zeae]|uniref:Uncharacterized protein n=1 Tax=Mesobacillus zeae TaxID=1917180 RepID=A0A398AWQ3_9BACI|nr:hypothetical protein D1970_20110 [Mesobacillus zeae]
MESIATGEIKKLKSVVQNQSLEMQYTRNKDFTDEAAEYYWHHLPPKAYSENRLKNRDPSLFINPKLI